MVTLPDNDTVLVYDADKRNPILIAIQGRYWKVLGECNQCGECCLNITLPNEWDDYKDENGKCKYLQKEIVDDQVKYRCMKQWNKPAGCVLYPFNPLDKNHFTENCSYSFEEITKLEFLKLFDERV